MPATSISANYVNTTKTLLILPREISFWADSDSTTQARRGGGGGCDGCARTPPQTAEVLNMSTLQSQTLLILPREIPFWADSDSTTLLHATVEMTFRM